MIKINQAIIVEGKYDKIKLSSFIDGLIIVTDGFGIFKNKEKKEYLRRLADERGLLIITDSDSAGFLIRNHLQSFIDKDKIFNAYIPQIYGKEKRKEHGSKEGTLGVEGLDANIIMKAVENSGALKSSCEKKARKYTFTSADLFNMKLAGYEGSGKRKEEFLSSLKLPKHMSSSALLKYLNTADEETITASVEEYLRGI